MGIEKHHKYEVFFVFGRFATGVFRRSAIRIYCFREPNYNAVTATCFVSDRDNGINASMNKKIDHAEDGVLVLIIR